MQKYRPEIDGLRAVAVIPVILFHAGFESFSGGYVGVDVFFVISGYLITSIIYGEIQNKTFSIIRFYERRARRILPALIFVSAVCIPFAWMWMLPSDFEDFSRSLVAVSVFASNIFFWRDSGYFSVAVELKPLLHTWSLGVEEQFYILFPVILLLCRKVSTRATVTIVMLGTIASIVLAEIGSRTYPAATFYLIPTRAWELGTGALLAIHAHDFGRNKIPLGQSGYRAIGDGAGVLGRAW
jgi:peptidoglycan/LPS O-acetylase OafA/YrhL